MHIFTVYVESPRVCARTYDAIERKILDASTENAPSANFATKRTAAHTTRKHRDALSESIIAFHESQCVIQMK